MESLAPPAASEVLRGLHPGLATHARIAVVGGGPSGLAAAWALERLGFQHVTVLEQHHTVGGMCESVPIQGRTYDLGGQVLALERSPTMAAVASELGVEMEDLGGHKQMVLDVEAGGAGQDLAVFKDFVQMVPLTVKLQAEAVASGRSGVHAVSALASEPADEFLRSRGYRKGVPLTTACAFTSSGYGYTDDIPYAYLHEFNRTSLLGRIARVKGGYTTLWRKLAASLSDVRCNTRVTRICRPDSGPVTVQVANPAGDATVMEFDKIIVTGALPFRSNPTYRSSTSPANDVDAAAVAVAGPLQWTQAESTLFSKVRTVEYYTTVVRIQGLHHLPAGFFYFKQYIHDPNTIGHPVAMQRFYPDTDVFLFWSYGNAQILQDKVIALVNEDVEKIGGTVVEFILQRKWNYFPHVQSRDMKAGFYDELSKLQGQNNTYYVGGLLAFELTERNAAFSINLVAQHFGSTQLTQPYVKRLIQVPERELEVESGLPGYNVEELSEAPGMTFPDLPTLDAYLNFYAKHEVTKDKVLYTWLDEQGKEADARTYADLNVRASIIAHRLLTSRSKLKYGDRVLLLHPPGLDFVEAFFGCLRARVLPVPLIPPDPGATGSAQALLKVQNVAKSCAAKAILSTSTYHIGVKAGILKNRITSSSSVGSQEPQWPDLPWYHTDLWTRNARSGTVAPRWTNWLLDKLSPGQTSSKSSSPAETDSQAVSPRSLRFLRPPPSPRRSSSFNSDLARSGSFKAGSEGSSSSSSLNSNQDEPALSTSPRENGYSSSESSESAESFEFEAPHPADVCFLQFTSGSTGDSKGVMITHAGLIHNVKLMRRQYKSSSKTVLVSWLPQYHDMGLIGGLFTALVSGGTAVVFSPVTFIKKPLLWMEALSNYRATHSAGPNFAFELTIRRIEMLRSTGRPVPTFDLSSLRFIMISAEPVRHQTVARFLDIFRPSGLREQIMAPAYGLAENCVFVCVAYGQQRPIYVDWEKRVCCGYVERGNQDMDIRIVNPETREEAAEGKEGEIWVSSPSAGIGYWGLEELSREVFQNFVKSRHPPSKVAGQAGRTFVRTGDLGRVVGDMLFLTGRIKDLIIVAGRNIYPSDIEKTVENCSTGIRPGCSAAFGAPVSALQRILNVGDAAGSGPDDVGIVVVTEVRDDKHVDPELVGRIKSAVAAEHGVEVAHVNLVKPRTIAKTTSGKIRRLECLQRFLNGKLVTAKPNVLVSPRARGRMRVMRRSESAPINMQSSSFPAAGRGTHSRNSSDVGTAAHGRPSKADVTAFLRQILAEKTGIAAAEISETHSFTSYNIDSVAIVWAASKLSDFLGLHIAAIDIYTAGCIAELADMADGLLAKEARGRPKPGEQGKDVNSIAVEGAAAGGMKREKEIQDYLVKLVGERTGLEAKEISTTDVLTSFGIDSVGVVWAAQKLAEFLGIHIAAIDVYTAGSIAELSSMALSLLNKASAPAANKGQISHVHEAAVQVAAPDHAGYDRGLVEEEIETELIPDADLASALEPSARRKLVITCLQVLGLLYIAAVIIFPAFVVYGQLAKLLYTGGTAEAALPRLSSLLISIVLLPVAWLAYLALTALSISFFATTLLRPNYSIQTAIPLWSLDYVQWWVLYRLCDFASNHVVGIHLRGTVFLSYWYRLLGAHIGKHVFLDSTDITDPSLLYVGNGAVVSEGATVQSHDVRGGVVRFQPIRIGTGSVVGPYAVVQQGTILDAGASVSALGRTEIGEKVAKKHQDHQANVAANTPEVKIARGGQYNIALRHLWGLYIVGLVSTVSAIVSYISFLWLTSRLLVIQDSSPLKGLASTVRIGFFCFPVAATLPWALAGLSPLLAFQNSDLIFNFLYRFANSKDALLVVACSGAAYLVYGLTLSAITCLLKWHLVGNAISQRTSKDGALPVNSDLGFRVWLVHRLLTAAHMKFTLFLSGTQTLVCYLRSLGARIGNMASIRGVNALLDPDLLTLGDESHLGDFAKIITSTVTQTVVQQAKYKHSMHFGRVEVGSKCIVGAQGVLLPGVKLEDRAILGANSVAVTGSVLKAGGVYVGVENPVMIYQNAADGNTSSKSKKQQEDVKEEDFRIREMDPLYKKLVANLAASIAKTTLSVDARYFHRLGVAGKGTLTILSNLPDTIPAHDVFSPGKTYGIIIRHSNSLSGDDDARSDGRGASVRLLRPGTESDAEQSMLDLTLKSGRAFNCRNIVDFVNYMMKSHEQRVAFVQKNPRSGIASWDSLRLPNSYAELHYYSNVARLFRPSGSSQEYYVKFRMRPADERFGEEEGKVEAFDFIPPETGAIPRSPSDTRPPRFLADDFRRRLLSADGVKYVFQIQLRPVSEDVSENEDALDCTKPWDEAAYPYTDVGLVHLTDILDGEVTERLQFNPINGTKSIDMVTAKTALENASIDHGRSLAYSIAQYLRTGQPLPPTWERLLKQSDVMLQLPEATEKEQTQSRGGCPAMSGGKLEIAPSRYQQMLALTCTAEPNDKTEAIDSLKKPDNMEQQTSDQDLLTLGKVLNQALSRWMQPLLQLFIPIALFALAYYPSLLALSFVGATAGPTWMLSLLPVAYLWSGLLFTGFSVACRWALVGRTRDGSSSELWGFTSLRDTTWQAINLLLCNSFLELGKGSLLGSFYLQLLGADIGDSAGRVAYMDTLLTLNPDLLTVRAGTAVGRNALVFGHLYEGGKVGFKANEIGQSCYVGSRALLLPGLKMEDSAELGALALGMKGEIIAAY